MAEENKNAINSKTAATPEKVETEEKESVKAPPPTLADDFLKLEQLNLLRTVVIRMQGGRHPSREIENLLQRRMNFSRDDLQGPYVVRLICTIMFIFFAATFFWAILWAIGNAFALSYFTRLISTGIATLFAAAAGVAIFHPSSLPDEKAIADAIEARMNELRKELEENNKEADQSEEDDTDKESDEAKPQPTNKQTAPKSGHTQKSDTASNDQPVETKPASQNEPETTEKPVVKTDEAESALPSTIATNDIKASENDQTNPEQPE